jgi:predicted NBD/HSP70 family sugar kinase
VPKEEVEKYEAKKKELEVARKLLEKGSKDGKKKGRKRRPADEGADVFRQHRVEVPVRHQDVVDASDGGLRREHGVAGEIAFMPISEGRGTDEVDARRRGALEASASASAVVRAARRAGMRGPVSARRVFTAAARGDERAAAIVAQEARLVAKAICSVVTVVDPELVVLGGGIGQAPGFAAAVTEELRQLAPVLPEVRVSALGTDAVVDGCLASGAELAWRQLTALLPSTPA